MSPKYTDICEAFSPLSSFGFAIQKYLLPVDEFSMNTYLQGYLIVNHKVNGCVHIKPPPPNAILSLYTIKLAQITFHIFPECTILNYYFLSKIRMSDSFVLCEKNHVNSIILSDFVFIQFQSPATHSS